MLLAFTFLRKKYLIGCILLFLFCSVEISSAQKNVNYFIEQAKAFSPLTKDNKNLSKINLLETERLRAAFLKPQLTFNAGYTVSPILNLDNNKARIDFNSEGSNNYLGYDLGATNGGNYFGMFNLTQPLWMTEKFKPIAEQLLIGNKINENNIELTNHDIEKNVIDQYINCLFDLKQADYVSEILKLINQNQRKAKHMLFEL